MEEKSSGGTREERTFASWINSFDLGEGCHIHNLYHDIATTPALLKVIDKLRPIVDWKRVNVVKMNKVCDVPCLPLSPSILPCICARPGLCCPCPYYCCACHIRLRSHLVVLVLAYRSLPFVLCSFVVLSQFKHIENLNYAVALCRDTLRLNMPATGGVDLYEGNRTLVLGLVWQLMRMQVIEMLKDVGGGSNVTDADIVSWANAAVAASGRSSRLSSFRVRCGLGKLLPQWRERLSWLLSARSWFPPNHTHARARRPRALIVSPLVVWQDESVANGAFLLDLLTAVEPRAVNPELVTPGSTPEEAALNAKYVLSVARKLGCLGGCDAPPPPPPPPHPGCCGLLLFALFAAFLDQCSAANGSCLSPASPCVQLLVPGRISQR